MGAQLHLKSKDERFSGLVWVGNRVNRKIVRCMQLKELTAASVIRVLTMVNPSSIAIAVKKRLIVWSVKLCYWCSDGKFVTVLLNVSKRCRYDL